MSQQAHREQASLNRVAFSKAFGRRISIHFGLCPTSTFMGYLGWGSICQLVFVCGYGGIKRERKRKLHSREKERENPDRDSWAGRKKKWKAEGVHWDCEKWKRSSLYKSSQDKDSQQEKEMVNSWTAGKEREGMVDAHSSRAGVRSLLGERELVSVTENVLCRGRGRVWDRQQMHTAGSGEAWGSRGSKEIRDGKDLFGHSLLSTAAGASRSLLSILKCLLDDYTHSFPSKCFAGGWSFFPEPIVSEYTYRRHKEKPGER